MEYSLNEGSNNGMEQKGVYFSLSTSDVCGQSRRNLDLTTNRVIKMARPQQSIQGDNKKGQAQTMIPKREERCTVCEKYKLKYFMAFKLATQRSKWEEGTDAR